VSTRRRLLVVDDDARLAASLRRALAYEGYTVDDPAALVVARDQPPDLVVLDVMLPGLDGVEVCRRLRAGSDLPALMLTARDAVSDRVAGLDAGAWSSRRKEFEKHRLCAGSLAMHDKSAGNASSSKS
jgi:two-component system response regulator MprA